jgi:hypothetical protein
MRRDNPDTHDQGGLGQQYGSRNLKIIYNTVYDCEAGIVLRSDNTIPEDAGLPTQTDVIGNVIFDIHYENGLWCPYAPNGEGRVNGVAIACWYSARLVNNTIHDCDGGIYGRWGAVQHVFGNSITSLNTPLGYHAIKGEYAPGTNVYDKNAIENGSNIGIGAGYWNTVAAFNAEAYNIGGTQGASNIVPSSPLYVGPITGDPALRNYRLHSSSNLIDAISTPSPVYSEFSTLYSRSISLDRERGIRPWNNTTDLAGGNWDIGAYEFGSDISDKTAPVVTVYPGITGTTRINNVLTATAGASFAIPEATPSYQWKKNGSNIVGATSSTYTLAGGSEPTSDQGDTITVSVIWSNSEGSASATSSVTATIEGVRAPTLSAQRHFKPA